jgi:hypothetical protein
MWYAHIPKYKCSGKSRNSSLIGQIATLMKVKC